MPLLPSVNGKRLLRALLKMGFYVDRQKGSHARLLHVRDSWKRVTVPVHDKDIPQPTLKNIIRQAGITVKELQRNL